MFQEARMWRRSKTGNMNAIAEEVTVPVEREVQGDLGLKEISERVTEFWG